MAKNEYVALHERAHQAGVAAGEGIRPMPVVVVRRENPLDDTSPIVKQYAPNYDGLCGFAWVRFPGTSAFARALKKEGLARPSYPSGFQVWVRDFDQSLERKTAYAHAYAEILREGGVKNVYAQSRVD